MKREKEGVGSELSTVPALEEARMAVDGLRDFFPKF